MQLHDYIVAVFGLIGSASLTFCAWFLSDIRSEAKAMKKEMQGIKIGLAVHENTLQIILKKLGL